MRIKPKCLLFYLEESLFEVSKSEMPTNSKKRSHGSSNVDSTVLPSRTLPPVPEAPISLCFHTLREHVRLLLYIKQEIEKIVI